MPFSPYVIKNPCLSHGHMLIEFLATQYTSMDWLMDCWSNGYLRDTRCKPSSREPEVRLVTEWSMHTSSVTLGPTLSQLLNVSSSHELFFPVHWQSRWFIYSFICWTAFEFPLCAKHCAGFRTQRKGSGPNTGEVFFNRTEYYTPVLLRLKCTYKCRVWFSSSGVGPGSLHF